MRWRRVIRKGTLVVASEGMYASAGRIWDKRHEFLKVAREGGLQMLQKMGAENGSTQPRK